ncbi:hypothetical protein Aconfl_30800 [Algoriphagus confluentis]|uniref:Uncharacterized protein n=1 Tax=Algoriphagus confluentis TaxID=1697556 RepID=A0ABQ6PR91_9BACT|nr:hypothetical protein Aconfl_30800 [Algoriphagus confluentis]
MISGDQNSPDHVTSSGTGIDLQIRSKFGRKELMS